MHHSHLPKLISKYIADRGPSWKNSTRKVCVDAMGVLMAFLIERDLDLDRESLVRYHAFISEKYALSTAKKLMGWATSFCMFLYENEHIPKEIHKRLRIRGMFTPIVATAIPFEPYWRVINTYCPTTAHVFMVAYHTGMSLCDCCNLLWSEVDLDRGIIVKARQKTGVPCVIPVQNSRLYDSLCVMHKAWLKRRGLEESADFSDIDAPVSREAVRMYNMPTRMQTNLRRAIAKKNLPKFGWHDLRRLFVSRLLQAGMNPVVIAKMTGHRNLDMILRYATIHDNTIIDAFNEAKEKVPDDPTRMAGPVPSGYVQVSGKGRHFKRLPKAADA